LEAADRALYVSKRAGRNRVTVQTPAGSERAEMREPVFQPAGRS
jgi:hypothetical protein